MAGSRVPRVGKLRAVLEEAIVRADALLDGGVKNPVVVMVGRGRAGDVRALLDALGGKAVKVQEYDAGTGVEVGE